jgi:hypothetical protein
MYTGRVQRDSARWDSAALSTARVGFSQCSKHRYYRIAREFAAMRARIAYERLNELQRRRLIRRTSAHNPVPLLIGEHREVLHRLHISPTGQRFRRAWDVNVPPGALSTALEALMPARARFRLRPLRSMQRPRSQPALSTGCAHISSADCVVSNSERVAQGFRFQSSFPVETVSTKPRP